MISFFIALIILVVGYFTYGKVVDKIFGPDDRTTPAYKINDGVDCVPLKTWKAFLVQFLNIAGTGPIFGALMGAKFGPVVFLWIVFGTILGGAVHDYMTGMISARHDGQSIAELSGIYLGKGFKWVLRVFSIVLLVLVGTVFVTSPAALLSYLTPDYLTTGFFVIVILLYYILATLLPIDKLIGKLYPVFGAVLLIMALGLVIVMIFSGNYTIPEVTFQNLNPSGEPVWPYMLVTVACGAISGFHATQSPMVAKCIVSEKDGRKVFYGAMVTEAIVALIWAAAGMAFYGNTTALAENLTELGQSGVVYDIAMGMLGKIGGLLAVIGVIVCPITSGDTAFRSARLILAETTGLSQRSFKKRLVITLPLLAIGALLTQLDFNVLWRYFSWSNQTLAMIALWVAAAYLLRKNPHRLASLIAALPAAFMSAVTMTYILMAPEGFRLNALIACPIGIVFALVLFSSYFYGLSYKVAGKPFPTHPKRNREKKRKKK